jgi:hypothetical protein
VKKPKKVKRILRSSDCYVKEYFCVMVWNSDIFLLKTKHKKEKEEQ